MDLMLPGLRREPKSSCEWVKVLEGDGERLFEAWKVSLRVGELKEKDPANSMYSQPGDIKKGKRERGFSNRA